VPDGGVHHLLDAVHVRREARHDQLLVRRGEDPLQGRFDVALVRREARGLGIGGVGHEQVDALLTEPGEAAQVGEPVVERELVHLEVAGVQDGARLRPDHHRQRVGDGVVDRQELQVELADRDPIALADDPQVDIAQAVLTQLLAHQRQGEPGAEDGKVAATPQQVRDGADVVLVAMGQHQRLRLVEPVLDQMQAGQDQVDAGVLLGREEHPAVDEQQFAVDLEGAHVPADVAVPAQRGHPQGVRGEPRRCSQGFSHDPNLNDDGADARSRTGRAARTGELSRRAGGPWMGGAGWVGWRS